MKRSRLLNLTLALAMTLFLWPSGAVANAADATTDATGTLTISKTVEGEDVPDADTEFEFVVRKGDAATPATGDETNMAIPVAIAVVGIVVVAGAVIIRRRNK